MPTSSWHGYGPVLDATVERVVAHPQQDLGQAADFAPMPSGSRPTRWYVLATHHRAEMRAHACLHLRGWKPYLPLITIRTPKREYRTQALYPGYLFVSLDLSRPWHPVTACPGVFSLLSIEGMPTPCPYGVVEALRAGEEARRTTPTDPPARWAPGAVCAPAEGMLAGHRGVILRVTRSHAVVALVILGGLREVTIPLDSLAPAT